MAFLENIFKGGIIAGLCYRNWRRDRGAHSDPGAKTYCQVAHQSWVNRL